jgi:sec-independent protein translocase protein TatC
MAVLTRRRRDPEGRMPLRAHLVELRNRLMISALAIAACSVVGWYTYDWVLFQLTAPLEEVRAGGRQAVLNYANVTAGFNQRILISLWVGVILASPMWIYQIFAFITPGLTRKERWYAIGFLAAAVPLFLSGVLLAWLVLPNAVTFLISFTPDDSISASILPANEYLSFVTRVLLAFGIAFLTPVVMVALSMVGLVPSRTWVRGWRLAVVACFVFAAIASPTPDIVTMFALAGPMVGLYFLAVAVTWVVDRRRARREGSQMDVDDDEASVLDEEPRAVPQAEPVAEPGAGDDPAAAPSTPAHSDIP